MGPTFLCRMSPQPLAAFARDARGVTAVEFALLALPFFLTLFMLFQTAAVYIVQMSLTFETQRMARMVRTGKVTNQKMSMPEFRTELCRTMLSLVDCNDVAVDLKAYDEFSDIPRTLPIVNGTLDRGNFKFEQALPGTIMALRVFVELPIVGITQEALSQLSNGHHLVAVTTVFKTEPF